jgi:ATP-dependent exoDNAse (exonuclease V) beta subunit
MALFSFGKKQEEQVQQFQPPPQGPPTDLVLSMREQGLSNNQIIQNLYRQGFQPSDVADAMNQANAKESVENMPTGYFNQQYQDQGQAMQQNMQQQQQPMQQGMEAQQGYQEMPNEHVEEIVEAIVNEKWNEIVKNVNKITEWKDKTETRLSTLEQQFKDLKQEFDKLHDAILGKIGEYDQNIVNIGTDIKAMEKVFQKILPTLTDNITELSRITDDLKKGTAKK